MSLDGRALEDRDPRTTFLPFSPPLLGPEEKAEVMDTLDSGWITKGPKTERFEREFAAYCGVPHAAALHSCTAALHLALLALEIGSDDEVMVPTMTFASTAHVVAYVGARPVFVDCGPDFTLSAEQIEARITSRTRAIIPMHYGGQACEMDAILAIARRHSLRVVEDAAHAAGTEYRGKKIGSLESDVACFSFYATKNMTTGEGGMATSWNGELVEQIKVLSMYGIADARRIWQRYAPKGSWWYDILELGYKYNMMDIQAALGIHQLRRLDEFIERRTHLSQMYAQGFADLEAVQLPPDHDRGRHAWHLFPILVQPEKFTIGRERFIEELRAENIGTSVMYVPLHLHTYYRKLLGHEPGDFPTAQYLYERVINLPISPRISDEDVLDVIAAVRRIAKRNRR
jgi:dTDP-4-amino-4,6-dideoxygalactose transaminase